MAKGLTTDIIKNLGLSEAIFKLAKDMMDVNPVVISCELESFIEKDVNDKFKLNVFRILLEHLNNILKHANASKVIISLMQNNQSILLSIFDNGVGFDTNKKQEGIGVGNIKSRVATFNGRTDFVSKPGRGCILTIEFPVSSALLTGA